MKLILINSSARVGGNTAHVMTQFEAALSRLAREREIDIETERVNLAHPLLKTCLGCRVCFDKGEQNCPLKDDLLTICERMRAADGYIIASPVYVEDVNGVMKNWIDRMAFTSHRPAFFGKHALLFTTSGIGSSNHALQTMSTAFGTWGIKVTRRMRFRLGALSEPEEIRLRYGNSIYHTAKQFLDALQQPHFTPSFYSLIAFTVQQAYWRKHERECETYDSLFWREQGWLITGRRYYDRSMERSFGALVARQIGKIIALFFG